VRPENHLGRYGGRRHGADEAMSVSDESMPANGPADSKSAHPLDQVIWKALTSRNRNVAEGDHLALRYLAPIAPFAAMSDTSTASFRALLALLPANDRIALFTVDEIMPPPFLSVLERGAVDQMLMAKMPTQHCSVPIVTLGAGDVPDMLALVEATHPGPFGPRTIELGEYIGVRRQGTLVAMAGERMRLDGFTEISAVCVHPSARGQGLAAELVSILVRSIASRGETPFLHVFNSNRPAIELYLKLGFILRRPMYLALLARASGDPECGRLC
jgi:predicted GNAT family acetyltransferase